MHPGSGWHASTSICLCLAGSAEHDHRGEKLILNEVTVFAKDRGFDQPRDDCVMLGLGSTQSSVLRSTLREILPGNSTNHLACPSHTG